MPANPAPTRLRSPELASALAGAASLDELCTSAKAVRASLAVDRASVLLFDQEGVMRFRAWNGLSERIARPPRATRPGLRTRRTRSRSSCPTSRPSPGASEDPGEGIRALAFVPIAYAGRLLGKYMLYFDARASSARSELVLAGAVADQIAVAVEQHRVADELRASHEQLEIMFRRVGEGVTVQRPDGTLAYANDAAASGLGFDSAEELLATPPAEILGRFEILDEGGEPFPLERFPGRRVLQGEDEAEAIFRYRAARHRRGALVEREGDGDPRRRGRGALRGQPLPRRHRAAAGARSGSASSPTRERS